MMLYVSIAALLLVKFGVYAYYANILNTWFSKTRNIYGVSAARLGISLVFTGINFTLTASTLGANTPAVQLLPLLTAFLFGALAWYIILRIFYSKEHNPLFIKALVTGAIISGILGTLSGFLAFIGLMSSVNFC